MKIRVLLATGLALGGGAVCAPTWAQEVPTAAAPADPLPADPRVTTGVLQNGLRYYIRANDQPAHRAELRLVVNAGSVLEDDDQLGLAHFVEHMAFNGTRNFPKQELVNYLELTGMRFGPDLNAFTSFDETVYMLTVPTDSAPLLATAFRVLEDWAWGLAFDSLEIEKERGVVMEEWRLGRGAGARMRDEQFPVLFRGSRYAERLPIGTPEVLEGFDHEALERFYRTWYRPDLMAVIAVGDFDVAAVEALIRREFSRIPAVEGAPPRPVYDVPNHRETLYAIATDPEATNSQVAVYFKQPVRSAATASAYRQGIVERLYNQMLNERLFELSQLPEPPYLGAYSGKGRLVRSKEVYMLAALVQEGRISPALVTLLTEAERVSRHGFTATELERAKRDYLRGMEQAYAERENTESRAYASEYLRNFLEGEPFPGIARELELVREYLPTIELAELNGLAREWVSNRNRVVMANAPEKDDLPPPTERQLRGAMAAIARSTVEPYVDAVLDEPLLAAVPSGTPVVAEEHVDEVGLTVWELGNGVRVLLKPTDFKDDEILVDAWSPGGSSLAPDESYVSATTAAGVVQLSGVGAFSLVELDKALAGRAVSVGPHISSLYEGIGGYASPQDVEVLFQLIYLYFTAPREDTAAFASYRNRAMAGLQNRSASPDAAFWDTLDVTLAQHHFRRRPPSAALFSEMDFEAGLEFYRDRYADASDFSFVFVGAFEPDSLRPLVETYLGGLPSIGREETWRDEGIAPPEGVIRKFVYRGLEPKGRTVLVFTGEFEHDREQRYALRALQDVLQVRLRERLREELGGTYSVDVSTTSALYPRPEYSAYIQFGSDPERLDELVATVFAQIDSLQTVGPTEEELAKVREAQRRTRETSLEQNGFWLGVLLRYDRYGLQVSDVLRFDELVETLDARMIQEAARRYLRHDNYVQVTLFPESTD
jgi:zinc protease